MPHTDVVFYQEDRNDVPVLDWLKELLEILLSKAGHEVLLADSAPAATTTPAATRLAVSISTAIAMRRRVRKVSFCFMI